MIFCDFVHSCQSRRSVEKQRISHVGSRNRQNEIGQEKPSEVNRAYLGCQAAMEWELPSSLAEYAGLHSVGEGRACTAYAARTVDGQRVCLKVIPKQKIRELELRVEVQNEVVIHSQLQHKAVIELLHVFEDLRDNAVVLVMELAPLGDLASWCCGAR